MRDVWLAEADRRAAGLEAACCLDHDAAELQDGGIAHAEPFLRSVGDRTHGLPHRDVLIWNAADAGEISRRHGRAVLPEIVIPRADLAPTPIDIDTHLGTKELPPCANVGAGPAPPGEERERVRVV